MLEGGCNCGNIRYTIDAEPIIVAQCHCKNCQRQSGSAFSVNVVVPAASVSLTGDLRVYADSDTLSGKIVYRKFCATCGSPIISEQEESNGVLILKVGTLDDPSALAPAINVWTSTAMPWVAIPEGKRSFPQNP